MKIFLKPIFIRKFLKNVDEFCQYLLELSEYELKSDVSFKVNEKEVTQKEFLEMFRKLVKRFGTNVIEKNVYVETLVFGPSDIGALVIEVSFNKFKLYSKIATFGDVEHKLHIPEETLLSLI